MTIKQDGKGMRKDDGKPRVDLLPPDALLCLGEVYEVGSRKYSARNWEAGMKWSKVVGPLLRHTYKWMTGQKRDEETGLLHSAHMAWNAIAILTYELRDIGEDDRNILNESGTKNEVDKTDSGIYCGWCFRDNC